LNPIFSRETGDNRSVCFIKPTKRERTMAGSFYKIIEVVGTSETSWEDAAKGVVEEAAKNLRDMRVAEITKLDMKIQDGKVASYRARVSLSFKYHS
jgi:flavin-binding protein dodecin